MNVITTPAARFGWEGQTVEYVVKAEGATQITAPKKTVDGLRVRVLDSRPVGNGVEARVAVEVASPVFY